MQPTIHSRAQKISVQRFKVEGETVQPCLPVANRQAHFFLPKSLASF